MTTVFKLEVELKGAILEDLNLGRFELSRILAEAASNVAHGHIVELRHDYALWDRNGNRVGFIRVFSRRDR